MIKLMNFLNAKYLYKSTDLEYVQNDLFRKEEEN